ncbi:unnamed protein product, partial [Phaeothamnion confervicola]
KSPPPVAGVAIATCCHHACNWDDYVGRALFLREGFDRVDFEAICKMSGWVNKPFQLRAKISASNCGRGGSDGSGGGGACEGSDSDDEGEWHGANAEDAAPVDATVAAAADGTAVAAAKHLASSSSVVGAEEAESRTAEADRRTLLGRRCKRLIDAGRVEFLQEELGLSTARIVQYCDARVTPENALILASRPELVRGW